MNITIVTPPQFEPITVAEAYAHLRWDAEEEGSPPETVYPLQDLIERNIATARAFVEKGTRRSLVEQTIRLSVAGCRGYIDLLRPPFIAIESVQYFDSGNVLQTIDPADYYVTDGDEVPRLYMGQAFAFPMAFQRPDAFRVTYRTGYAPAAASPMTQEAAAANVPAMLKDAILIQVQLLSDRFDPKEREDLERARDALITHERVHTFGWD
jgi:uncharacterized phiE125 gp8 family phage protein